MALLVRRQRSFDTSSEQKSEIRGPKSERNPKTEIRNLNDRPRFWLPASGLPGERGQTGFGFLSDFGFRSSDFSVPMSRNLMVAVLAWACQYGTAPLRTARKLWPAKDPRSRLCCPCPLPGSHSFGPQFGCVLPANRPAARVERSDLEPTAIETVLAARTTDSTAEPAHAPVGRLADNPDWDG